MEALTNIKTMIIDMDGVLWHGSIPVPGLIDFFATLRELEIRFILATNNASQTPDQYVDKLAKMGVTVGLNEILTSGMATATYLAEQTDPLSTRIFVVGEDGARLPLIEKGFTLTDIYDVKNNKQPGFDIGADIVVCGKDETLTWHKLATATLNIRAGAQFIATNADTTLPTELGVIHGNGAILAALETATGVKPTIIGKPEPTMYQQALAILEAEPEATIAIGDRLETDILGAIRADIRSLLVLTGISTENDVNACAFQPTWIMQDIKEVTEALRKLAN